MRRAYIVCGYTDMRGSINGLALLVQSSLGLDPFSRKLFLFCGKHASRMKTLLWEDDVKIKIAECLAYFFEKRIASGFGMVYHYIKIN